MCEGQRQFRETNDRLSAYCRRMLVLRAALVCFLVHTFGGHTAPGRHAIFSPDSRFLASASADGTVKLWRIADRKLVRTLMHPAGVTSIAFSPDGQWLASGSYDGIVRVWGGETPASRRGRRRASFVATAAPCGPSPSPPTDSAW